MSVHQRTLFGAGPTELDLEASAERLNLAEGAWVDIVRGFLRGGDTLLDVLVDTVDWRQGRRWMYDRMVDDPRLSRWYKKDQPFPHDALTELRSALQRQYRVTLTGVGLNYYRDGRDSVAFHRDRELRHLDDTLIAIVTLGSQRPFLIRPRLGGRSIDVSPASGDLLVMGGTCQLHHEHGVPKVARAGPRLSISYRWCARASATELA